VDLPVHEPLVPLLLFVGGRIRLEATLTLVDRTSGRRAAAAGAAGERSGALGAALDRGPRHAGLGCAADGRMVGRDAGTARTTRSRYVSQIGMLIKPPASESPKP